MHAAFYRSSVCYLQIFQVLAPYFQTQVLQRDMVDLQEEFQKDLEDYLETIRRQSQHIRWLELVIIKIHPCLRRDCNYMNLDLIKQKSHWDFDAQIWHLPKLSVPQAIKPVSSKSSAL